MRLLALIEPLLALICLWVTINIIHAVFTIKGKKVESAFFFVSNFIKRMGE